MLAGWRGPQSSLHLGAGAGGAAAAGWGAPVPAVHQRLAVALAAGGSGRVHRAAAEAGLPLEAAAADGRERTGFLMLTITGRFATSAEKPLRAKTVTSGIGLP